MAQKKNPLGRNLSSMLSKTTLQHAVEKTQAESSGRDSLRELPLDVISPGPYQPRSIFDTDRLEELAESIRHQGVIQPVVVRLSGDKQYELIAGERRWRAAQMAGIEKIPAIIRDVPDEIAIAMALVENIQREDLNPIEEATALRRLVDEFQMTHQEAGDAVGRSRSAVSNLLRLLELSAEVRELVENLVNQPGVSPDKRFVYYLLASTGICVVPLSSFFTPEQGFRITLLERDEATFTRIFKNISANISKYLSSHSE